MPADEAEVNSVRRAGLAVVLAGLTFIVGCQSGPQAQPAPAGTSPTASPPATSSPATSPSATSPSATPAPRAPTVPTPISPPAAASERPGALRPGDRGPTVLDLQRRLVSFGYWLGVVDGRYGPATTHAVTAFQKTAGLARDGVAGPDTLAALDRASRPRPRSSAGRVVEVDLRRQLLLVATDGRVQWVIDTSTGSVPGTTPRGRYKVLRQVDGYDPGPLGVLYRPKYFVGGVAVHGYPTVPSYPASHGCVRVTNAAMDWLWASGALPIGGRVWVY